MAIRYCIDYEIFLILSGRFDLIRIVKFYDLHAFSFETCIHSVKAKLTGYFCFSRKFRINFYTEKIYTEILNCKYLMVAEI